MCLFIGKGQAPLRGKCGDFVTGYQGCAGEFARFPVDFAGVEWFRFWR